MKKYYKLFIVICIFLILGMVIPLLLKSYNGINKITNINEDRIFLQKSIEEADIDFDSLENFTVLRLKAVNIIKDVPNCDGSIYKYVGFIKAYSFFNIPYYRNAVIYSKDGANISGGAILSSKRFTEIQKNPGIGLCF